ncbi:aromatic ring-hydroxylating oxygenase subunit alpha [Acidithiobacillus ferrivorans]|nr:aromatic ring-hydroxylating dioxygenase subunit alpha [Acidithiobacillus ferrivorans]
MSKEESESEMPPREIYYDDEYARLEFEKVIASSWMPIAHTSQIPNSGDMFSFDVYSEKFFLVNDQNKIYCLSRICPHRGADLLNSACTENKKSITCPYHSWVFDLSGKLKYAPQAEGVKNFVHGENGLRHFKTEIWNEFIFVNIDGKAEPLSRLYNDLGNLISPWQPDELEVVYSKRWHGNFNWKVMVENWAEFYHHVGAHSDTLEYAFPSENTTIDVFNEDYVRTKARYSERYAEDLKGKVNNDIFPFDEIENLPLTSENCQQWVYVAYPAFLIATFPDSIYWIRVLPKGVGECEVTTLILINKKNKRHHDYDARINKAIDLFESFHKEDMEINESVYKNIKNKLTAASSTSRLFPTERQIYRFHKYLSNAVSI